MVDFTVYKGSKSGAIVKATTTREVKPGEVLVRITHSGLCGTDEHYKCADMVLGHEGVGIVEVYLPLHDPSFTALFLTPRRNSAQMSQFLLKETPSDGDINTPHA